MEEHSTEAPPRRSPVQQTFPNGRFCLVALDDLALQSGIELDRIALMIAAALPGATVRRVTSDFAQLEIDSADYHQKDLSALSANLLKEMLHKLPQQPILTLERHPHKPYIWVLVMGFRVQRDHLYAMRRIPGVMAATLAQDISYDRYMVELFVPALGQEGKQGADMLLHALQGIFNFAL